MTGCAASQEDKELALAEVKARGFGNPTLAPDVMGDSRIYIYATYRNCRLRLVVNDGNITYAGVGDASPAILDDEDDFEVCRTIGNGNVVLDN